MTHMIRMLTIGLVVIPAIAAAQDRFDAPSSLEKLKPFLDAQTVAVAHLDIRKVDVKAAVAFVAKDLPADVLPQDKAAEGVTKGTEIQSAFIQAGFAEAFVVVSLTDLPEHGPFFVLPKGKDANPKQLQELLEELGVRIESGELHGAIVLGADETLKRLAANPGAANPDLAKALAAAGDAALRLAVSPTDDTRRGLRESLPPLPQELGGLSGAELTDSFGWLAAGLNLPPKLSLQITLQAKDARAAQQLRSIAAAALDLLTKNEQVQREFPPIKGLAPLVLPKVERDRLVLKIDQQEGNLTKIVDELIKPAVAAARAEASRMQGSNNLKQLMLAMHVYHDLHKHLPAQASRKDGKKLLSWRVHLLPFLEQKELYDQFHLDEPWDSDHNKKLIEKMPSVFAASGLSDEMVKQGLTTYVVPVGPKTVFEGEVGIDFSKIPDGTSNTIAIVEVAPQHAVVWTKPEDWKVDFSKPYAGLLGKPEKDTPKQPAGFLTAFCDGSVHFISATLDWEMVRRLLQKDDGEVVGEF